MYMPFYSNEKIEHQLDLIHHLLQFVDELLLVSGKKGVGKSRQLQELIRRLGEGWQICHLSGSQNRQISQVFEHISQSFGYDYSAIASNELLDGFRRHLEQKEAGKTYALLIDDAEFMEASTLEMITHLSRLQNSKGRLLRVILFGGKRLLEAPLLKTVPFRELTIEALDQQQSQDYIDFCLEQGRYAIDKLPSAARQRKIVKVAGGLPGKIEIMLQNGPKMLDSWRQIATIAVIVLLAVAVDHLLDNENDMFNEGMEQAAKFEVASTPKLAPIAADAPPVVAPQEKKVPLISELLKQKEVLIAPEKEIANEPLIAVDKDSVGAISPQKITPQNDAIDNMFLVEGGENRPDEEPVKESLIKESPAKESLAKKPTVEPIVSEKPIEPKRDSKIVGDRAWFQSQPATSYTIQLVAAERESALDELIKKELLQKNLARFSFVRDGHTIHVLTQGVYSERPSAELAANSYSMGVKPWIRPIGDIQQLFKDAPAPVKKVVAKPIVSTLNITGLKDSAWLWSQDPETFTLQIMAGGSMKPLQRYVDTSVKLGVTAILKSKRDGKPWYILLHGLYPSREAARSAIGKLPKSLTGSKPWIRGFSSVHDQLSKAN